MKTRLRATKKFIICKQCKITFHNKYYHSGIFCSRKCSADHQTLAVKKKCLVCNNIFSPKLHQIRKGNGKFCSEKCYGKSKKELVGDLNSNWKGDKVGYQGLHNWVIRWLGKPTKCEQCKKNGLTGRQIHWANIDHEYRRDLDDWVRLCCSCHKLYDLHNGLVNN